MKDAIYRSAGKVNDSEIKLSLYESFLIKIQDFKKSVRDWFSDHKDGLIFTAVIAGFVIVIGSLIVGLTYLGERSNDASLRTTATAARVWALRHHTTLTGCERTDKIAVCQMADGNIVEYNLGLTIPTAVRRGE